MKKTFLEPEVEVCRFAFEEILTLSIADELYWDEYGEDA